MVAQNCNGHWAKQEANDGLLGGFKVMYAH